MARPFPTLKMNLTDRGSLADALDERINRFLEDVTAAKRRAAATATQTSRATVKTIRPTAPPRAGRYAGLRQAVEWGALKSDDGVQVKLAKLNADFPPWLVQEIGTGERAVEHVGGRPNPTGRPAQGANYVKTVKSQIGRRITPGLVWAHGGQYMPPDRARAGQDQLMPRSSVKGAPPRFDRSTNRSQPGIRISKEIEGQHFIQKGAQAGFRQYRESVLTAARTQLRKRRTG